MDEINPVKQTNNLFLLLIYVFCVVSNFWILTLRQDANTVYQLTKQIELFTLAEA